MTYIHTNNFGTKEYYVNGKLHRSNDLPAIEFANGSKLYYVNGKKHRDNNLPAYISLNGSKEYYLYGIQYSLDDFKAAVRDRTGLPWYKNPSLKGTQRH